MTDKNEIWKPIEEPPFEGTKDASIEIILPASEESDKWCYIIVVMEDDSSGSTSPKEKTLKVLRTEVVNDDGTPYNFSLYNSIDSQMPVKIQYVEGKYKCKNQYSSFKAEESSKVSFDESGLDKLFNESPKNTEK